MTFFTVWLAGIVINALIIWGMCRGETMTYKELTISGIICMLWPLGIPITLHGWFQESGLSKVLDKKAVTIPGGTNK